MSPAGLPDDLERLAAEYALGLAEGEELATAERLAEADPTFHAAAERWRSRLSELDGTARPVPSGEALWRRIEARIQAGEAPAGPAPARSSAPPPALRRLWENLPFWRAGALAAAAAALLLGVGAAVLQGERARAPILVAVLLTDEARPAAVVNAFADGSAELIPLQAIPVPPGRALEIWTLWDRQRGPVSVGLIDRARTVRLSTERLPRAGENQLFEITIEPETGSPTGRPTGPILMKGTTSTAL